jgi:site-specific recombinase XerD
LQLTGIRVSELLQVKVMQLEGLLQKGWIAINRVKRGPANLKAFLSPAGKKLLKSRTRDFELLLKYKENNEDFVFSPLNKLEKPLSRESLTKNINAVLHKAALTLEDKPNLTSHSFRSGYITSLWKDTNDIEFVRQAIGHVKLETTCAYIETLSEHERCKRINEIKSVDGLVYQAEPPRKRRNRPDAS